MLEDDLVFPPCPCKALSMLSDRCPTKDDLNKITISHKKVVVPAECWVTRF
jgi:hypothetical protein